jgi:hypothetical protein
MTTTPHRPHTIACGCLIQRGRVGKFGLCHAWVANHDPFRSPGAWFASSVLEVNSETGDGAFRDLCRGGMLYILRVGRMTGILTRTHRTGSDSKRIQIRPSGKCDSNLITRARANCLRPLAELYFEWQAATGPEMTARFSSTFHVIQTWCGSLT